MPKSSVSFVVRDTGETLMISALARRFINEGQKVKVLALGQAAQAALKQDDVLSSLVLTPEMVHGVASRLGELPDDLGGGSGHTVAFASPGDGAALAKAIQAPLIVTGVVSRAQQQLVQAIRDEPTRFGPTTIVGLYDSLALNKHCFLFLDSQQNQNRLSHARAGTRASELGAAGSFASKLDELWVPLAGLVVGVAQATHIPETRVIAMGHPETEDVLDRIHALQPRRENIRTAKLGASPSEKLIFFAGGRDKPGCDSYAQAFKLFVRGALNYMSPRSPRWRLVVSLHPASNGAIERQLLTELDAATSLRLIRTVRNPATSHEICNEELLVAADAIVTWNSTVGSQAALMPRAPNARQVLFIDSSDDGDDFAVVSAGLARRARNLPDVEAFFANLQDTQQVIHQQARDGLLVGHGVENMWRRIQILAANTQAKVNHETL